MRAVVLLACLTLSAAWQPPAAPLPLLSGTRSRSAVRALRASAAPELPSKKLLGAIVRLGGRATASDVAADAGIDAGEAQRQLLVLARLVGADLQVSDEGQIVFAFDDEKQVRRELRRATWRMRGRETWDAASPALAWMLRASFGLALLSSVTLVFSALMVLSASKDDRGGGAGESLARVPMQMWGPHPLDFLYYTRPYTRPGEMGFLQSCFSLLFGDADPNAADPTSSLAQRRSRAIAAVVRANGGTVTAEQLAPFLEPALSPDDVAAAQEAGDARLLPREDWVLPALLQFNGQPEVSEDGDILYSFPELMLTAAEDDAVAAAAALRDAAGALATAGGVEGARASPELAAALGWAENPPGWRPAVGDRVTVTRLLGAEELLGGFAAASRRGQAQVAARLEALAPLVGQQGSVTRDEGDALPFRVAFAAVEGAAASEQFFALGELAPAAETYLAELPRRFSTAPTGQLVAAGGLGAANLLGVLYLGAMLPRVRATTAGAAALLGTLRGLYPPLLLYAAGFALLPIGRAVQLRRSNERVRKRNKVRAAWAAALQSRPAAALGRKLRAAKERRQARRVLREEAAAFRSASEGGGSRDEAAREAAAMDEFDRKLAAAGAGVAAAPELEMGAEEADVEEEAGAEAPTEAVATEAETTEAAMAPAEDAAPPAA